MFARQLQHISVWWGGEGRGGEGRDAVGGVGEWNVHKAAPIYH